jgi:hypothetical protein
MKELKAPYLGVGSFYTREEISQFAEHIPDDFAKKIAITIPVGDAALHGRMGRDDGAPTLLHMRTMAAYDPRTLVIADLTASEICEPGAEEYKPKAAMSRIAEAAGEGLDAIVLNALWPNVMNLISFRIREYSCAIILRVSAHGLCDMAWPLEMLYSRLECYAKTVDCMMFEAGRNGLIRNEGDLATYAMLMEHLALHGMHIGLRHPLQEDMSLVALFHKLFPEGCIELVPGSRRMNEAERMKFRAESLVFARLLLGAPSPVMYGA